MSDEPLKATTTGEQDRQSAGLRDASMLKASSVRDETSLKTAGQRRVNIIWETTQALISYMVVGTAMYVSGRIALLVLEPAATERATGVAITAFVLISNCTFLIIGFYFGRTNHTRTGGIGAELKEER